MNASAIQSDAERAERDVQHEPDVAGPDGFGTWREPPLRIASPTSPVASGPAKNETAEPRSSFSLASWSSTRQSASSDRAGPRPNERELRNADDVDRCARARQGDREGRAAPAGTP